MIKHNKYEIRFKYDFHDKRHQTNFELYRGCMESTKVESKHLSYNQVLIMSELKSIKKELTTMAINEAHWPTS